MLVQFSHDAFKIFQTDTTGLVIVKCPLNLLCWVHRKTSFGHRFMDIGIGAVHQIVSTVLTNLRKVFVLNEVVPSLVLVT